VAPFAIDWQDSDATIRWYELLLAECPQGQLLLWQDQAPHPPSDEVEEWLATQRRITVIAFPKYPPEENPKEATWKDLKEEVSHRHWHETMTELRTAIDGYYQAGKKLGRAEGSGGVSREERTHDGLPTRERQRNKGEHARARSGYAKADPGNSARVSARRRNTRAHGNAAGSRTSRRRAECDTSAATFKS
jgi:hypothetical protein